jgi:hypothetical protein
MACHESFFDSSLSRSLKGDQATTAGTWVGCLDGISINSPHGVRAEALDIVIAVKNEAHRIVDIVGLNPAL